MHHDFEKAGKFRHRHMRERHRGRHGYGPFASGFGGGGFRAGRKLGAADLQLVILTLLKEKPRHGYELIKALEERSGGFYVPSPGMVYPALTYLEEAGYAVVFESEGAKKLYRLTEAGEAKLKEEEAVATAILAQLSQMGRSMERMRQAFTDEAMEEEMAPNLRAARRELRSILRELRHAAPEEQRRVADILKRAADEIRGTAKAPKDML